MSQERFGLFDTPPGRHDIRFALALVGLLFAAFLMVLPLSNVRVGEIVAFIPMVDAIVCAGELIIATLLYAQAAIFRSRALTMLASGFVFIALLLVAHALTFPGAFARAGLLEPGISSTAWIMVFRRLGFPLVVILYALFKGGESASPLDGERPPVKILLWVSGAIAAAAAASILAIGHHDLLPPIFENRSDTIRGNMLVFNIANIMLLLVAMGALFLRRTSVLDMWLLVALAGGVIQSMLNAVVHSRFTIGFYCVTLVILMAHLFVLIALIAESNRLYARLALSTATRNRERDTRMMSVEAAAAAISHEVGQPLAAVTLTASAALNFLVREKPDRERAIESLRGTIDAGNRAFDVISSIRAMFAKGTGSRSEFSLNDLVRETVSLLAGECAARRISLWLALDHNLPPIFADRVQIQRVLINLLTNAIEAIGQLTHPAPRITVRSLTSDGSNVLLEVSDSGEGIEPQQMASIFDPFFTTKASGTGLGLSLSRTIVEEHAGQLWASQNEGHGATFHLQLPRSDVSA